MKSSRHWLFLALAATAWSPRWAHAADDDVAVRDALVRFEEGKRLYRERRDYEGARIKFTQAYAVVKSPDILWNLAVSEVDAGHFAEAAAHLRQYDRHPRARPTNKARIAELMKRVQTQLAEVNVEAPAGSVIWVDGAKYPDVAPLPYPLDLAPGHHVIEARLGEATERHEILVSAGQRGERVTFSLASPLPPPVVVAAPPAVVGVPPEQPAGRSTARTVTTIALGAGALAATGVGVAFALKSHSDEDDAGALRGQLPRDGCAGAVRGACSELASAVDAQHRNASIATGAYIAGGALAVGAVAAWFLWPESRELPAPRAWIAPQLGGGPLGMQVGGRF